MGASLLAPTVGFAVALLRGGLQAREQQSLIQILFQSFRLGQLHAFHVFRKRRRLRRIQRSLAQLQNLAQLEFALEPVQCPQQVLLHFREIAAQRVLRKQVRVPRLNCLQTLRAVIGETRIETEILRQFANLLRLLDQAWLETRVADIQQRLNHCRVGLAAQVGDAVLGNHDVAQVAWDRAMAVLPDDVGTDLAAGFAVAAQDQDRARAFKGVALGNEIVLPADSAEHSSIFQLVGHPGTNKVMVKALLMKRASRR